MIFKINLVYLAEDHNFNIDDFIEYCIANFREYIWINGAGVYCHQQDGEMLAREYSEWYNIKERYALLRNV